MKSWQLHMFSNYPPVRLPAAVSGLHESDWSELLWQFLMLIILTPEISLPVLLRGGS